MTPVTITRTPVTTFQNSALRFALDVGAAAFSAPTPTLRAAFCTPPRIPIMSPDFFFFGAAEARRRLRPMTELIPQDHLESPTRLRAVRQWAPRSWKSRQ